MRPSCAKAHSARCTRDRSGRVDDRMTVSVDRLNRITGVVGVVPRDRDRPVSIRDRVGVMCGGWHDTGSGLQLSRSAASPQPAEIAMTEKPQLKLRSRS